MDKDNIFSYKIGKARMYNHVILFYIILKVPAVATPRVRNKGHSDRKRKDKIVPIWDGMIVYVKRTFQGITKKKLVGLRV